MSNHVHLELRVNEAEAQQWTDQQVVKQWHQLYQGNLLTQRFARGQAITSYEQGTLDSIITDYRRRLADISWFMRALNEPIARQASQEDGCTGRFWEGRFKSQALLDEGGLLACMAYVDLNPVRAKMTKTPEASAHTSIRLRIAVTHKGQQPKELLPFIGNERQQMPKRVCFNLKDYVSLVDQTGRVLRKNKRGCISNNAEDILTRLITCVREI
ncbi:transposase [Sinobacterium caligoides]|uniref:transposase n=1 Tax=Sinobacterium caligoides TaxID=933926 RepID=UPI000F4B1D94|nr:transposase [Sinobacterium caligoides]